MKLLKQKKIIRPHNKEIKEKDWVTLKRLIHGYLKIQMLKLSKNQKNLKKKNMTMWHTTKKYRKRWVTFKIIICGYCCWKGKDLLQPCMQQLL